MIDFINGCFELGGAFMLWLNVRRLYRDKTIKGVDWRVTGFWTAWGIWNAVIYYPSLDQWWSFTGGVAIVTVNAIWLAMAYYYMNTMGGLYARINDTMIKAGWKRV